MGNMPHLLFMLVKDESQQLEALNHRFSRTARLTFIHFWTIQPSTGMPLVSRLGKLGRLGKKWQASTINTARQIRILTAGMGGDFLVGSCWKWKCAL